LEAHRGARRALLVLPCLLVAGCGFELRRAPELRFRTIALTGFSAASPMAEALRRQLLSTSTTQLVEAPSQAEVVLEALSDSRRRSVVASTSAGQVREIRLRTRFGFRLRTPGGRELIAPTEVELLRDLGYDESAALAKEEEQALLFRAMHNDIASQVMRRLAALPGV
jgi:LPS-assembly lipoprotein